MIPLPKTPFVIWDEVSRDIYPQCYGLAPFFFPSSEGAERFLAGIHPPHSYKVTPLSTEIIQLALGPRIIKRTEAFDSLITTIFQ